VKSLYQIEPRKAVIKAKAYRSKLAAEQRKFHVRETVRALQSIESKGFVFTDSLKAVGEVIGHLKAHGIPYEYIEGGNNWNYAIRRLDKVNRGFETTHRKRDESAHRSLRHRTSRQTDE